MFFANTKMLNRLRYRLRRSQIKYGRSLDFYMRSEIMKLCHTITSFLLASSIKNIYQMMTRMSFFEIVIVSHFYCELKVHNRKNFLSSAVIICHKMDTLQAIQQTHLNH